MSQRALISLLTDFGTRDGYTGVMKGVILGLCPEATIIDLSHEIEPQDVVAASFLLAHHARFFPVGTIHVAVVDPGVGSDRAIVAAAARGQYFLAPDNGLLGFLLDEPGSRFFRIDRPAYWLPKISGTFHGRDIFAPVAGHLAKGVHLPELGQAVSSIQPGGIPACSEDNFGLLGRVVYVDRFGNLITNIPANRLPRNAGVKVHFGDAVLGGIGHHYAEKKAGEVLAIVGSFGYIEIAVNKGSAARRFPDYRKRLIKVEIEKTRVENACPSA